MMKTEGGGGWQPPGSLPGAFPHATTTLLIFFAIRRSPSERITHACLYQNNSNTLNAIDDTDTAAVVYTETFEPFAYDTYIDIAVGYTETFENFVNTIDI